jgi:hypothetical protein
VNTVLIVLTLLEVLLLVVVLAGYLIAIAATLRRVSHTLGLVTFGVRAIEHQTAPIGPALKDVNEALGAVAAALEDAVGTPTPESGHDREGARLEVHPQSDPANRAPTSPSNPQSGAGQSGQSPGGAG